MYKAVDCEEFFFLDRSPRGSRTTMPTPMRMPWPRMSSPRRVRVWVAARRRLECRVLEFTLLSTHQNMSIPRKVRQEGGGRERRRRKGGREMLLVRTWDWMPRPRSCSSRLCRCRGGRSTRLHATPARGITRDSPKYSVKWLLHFKCTRALTFENVATDSQALDDSALSRPPRVAQAAAGSPRAWGGHLRKGLCHQWLMCR